jgi:hypothetical protein
VLRDYRSERTGTLESDHVARSDWDPSEDLNSGVEPRCRLWVNQICFMMSALRPVCPQLRTHAAQQLGHLLSHLIGAAEVSFHARTGAYPANGGKVAS